MTPDEQFNLFWSNWPPRQTPRGATVKIGKAEAREWFTKNKPDDATFRFIMQAVARYSRSVDPKYVKDAFRWLKHRRWEDDCRPAREREQKRCYGCGSPNVTIMRDNKDWCGSKCYWKWYLPAAQGISG